LQVDAKTVVVYGFETAFGGGRSTGFGLIYDSVEGAFFAAPVASAGAFSRAWRADARALLRAAVAAHASRCLPAFCVLCARPRARRCSLSAPFPARPAFICADAKKVEPRHRLISSDLGGAKKTRSRKQWKELKKKKRVTWGTGRREAARMAKKAAAA
jgi:ribosomal protein S24E